MISQSLTTLFILIDQRSNPRKSCDYLLYAKAICSMLRVSSVRLDWEKPGAKVCGRDAKIRDKRRNQEEAIAPSALRPKWAKRCIGEAKPFCLLLLTTTLSPCVTWLSMSWR